jgi:hypothetical protein
MIDKSLMVRLTGQLSALAVTVAVVEKFTPVPVCGPRTHAPFSSVGDPTWTTLSAQEEQSLNGWTWKSVGTFISTPLKLTNFVSGGVVVEVGCPAEVLPQPAKTAPVNAKPKTPITFGVFEHRWSDLPDLRLLPRRILTHRQAGCWP